MFLEWCPAGVGGGVGVGACCELLVAIFRAVLGAKYGSGLS